MSYGFPEDRRNKSRSELYCSNDVYSPYLYCKFSSTCESYIEMTWANMADIRRSNGPIPYNKLIHDSVITVIFLLILKKNALTYCLSLFRSICACDCVINLFN